MFNGGDVVFQLIALFIPIALIAACILLVRSSKKRKEQLDRMEEKIDRAVGSLPKK